MKSGPIKIGSLEALQEVAQRFIQAHQDNDVETQRDLLRQLIEDEQQAYQRKRRLLAELKTLKQETRAGKQPVERVARLVALFRFAADLRAIGYTDLADQETGDQATRAAFDAAQELKSIGSEGMMALIGLLDDGSPDVRCSAGILLLREAPERALPVLEEIRKTQRGTSAAVRAGFALGNYRSETKSEP